ENAQPGGVEEVDAFEVDHDLVLAFADELDQAFAKTGCGVDVDLPAHGQDGVAVAFRDVETEIHRRASYPWACTENLARAPIATVIPPCAPSSTTWSPDWPAATSSCTSNAFRPARRARRQQNARRHRRS